MATRILFDPQIDLPDGATASNTVVIEATPTAIRTTGAVVVYPNTVSFTIRTAADVMQLATPSATQAWRLVVRRAGVSRFTGIPIAAGAVLQTRTVRWTDAPTIAWADLTELDPATLIATPDVVASWQATADLATAAKAAVDALVAGAPGALDTFLELANQLGADETAATALANLVATKAPLASPTFTGTVAGVTKAMVGLGNVDNTADTAKPVSTAQAAALATKVPTWQPSTAYPAGTVVLSPSGYLVQAIATFTSGASFNAVNWTQLSIDPASVAATSATLWKPSTAYATGQAAVNPSGFVVTALTSFTSGASYDPTKWSDPTSSTYVPVGAGAPALAHWYAKLENDPANAIIGFSGDSTSNGTTGPFPYLYAKLAGLNMNGTTTTVTQPIHTAPQEGLAGMTADTAHFLDGGNSGMTLAVYLSNYDANDTSTKSLRWMITQAPHLIVASWGINDVRGGSTSQAQLVTLLKRLVSILRAALPSTDIVLRMPNSLASNDYQANGFVTPNTSAQAYSTILRNAYLAIDRGWPNVVVADTQVAVFGTKSTASAGVTSSLMGDQLHPSQTGQYALADYLVQKVIGYYPVKQLTSPASTNAKALAQYSPWTSDPAVLDDAALFVKLGDFPYVTQGSGFLDITLNAKGTLTNYDLFRLPDGQIWQVPASGVTFSQLSAGTTRILAASLPTSAVTAGQVRVYRQAVSGDSSVNAVLADPSWRFKRVGRITAGSTTSMTVQAYSNTGTVATQPASDWATLTLTGDKVYVEGQGSTPVTVAAATYTASAANLALTGLSGTDWSAYIGRLVIIAGTHTDQVAGSQGVQGPAGGVAGILVSTRWTIPSVMGSISTATGTAGTDYAVPFVVLNSGQVQELMAQVSTANAGAAFRLGIRSSTNFLPDQLLIDAGTFDASVTGTKISSAFSAVSLTPGTLYWLTMLMTGTGNANVFHINGTSPLITGRNVAGEQFGSYSCGRSSTDAALPAAWGATYTPSNIAPLIRALAV